MTIEEYEQRAGLATRQTPVRRAKFPFADLHGQDLEELVTALASPVMHRAATKMRVTKRDELRRASAWRLANGIGRNMRTARVATSLAHYLASAALSRYTSTLYMMPGTH